MPAAISGDAAANQLFLSGRQCVWIDSSTNLRHQVRLVEGLVWEQLRMLDAPPVFQRLLQNHFQNAPCSTARQTALGALQAAPCFFLYIWQQKL